MESHLVFAQYLVVFLWVYADIAYSQDYYIAPSVYSSCPHGSFCLSLSQFAANSSSYFGCDQANLSLFFLPGNHTLDTEFTLADCEILSMAKVMELNGAVYIDCMNGSGRFNIRETMSASIKTLHFDGCGGNTVTRVNHFLLEDTVFRRVEGRFAALVLNEVAVASIVRSTFHSNTLVGECEHHDISNWVTVDYVYLEQNTSLTTSGTLYAISSTVVIESSQFRSNTAEIGGAIVAHNSSLHITRSIYKYNRASFGGVMVTSESTVIIDASTFHRNSAEVIGGVVIACNDSITIRSSTFIQNRAFNFSGVMETFGNTSLDVTNSTFTRNSAKNGGGVMRTFDKTSVNITNNTFTNNRANSIGGVVATYSESSFDIINSMFTNNNAKYGGVMGTFNKSSFTIVNSTFTKNKANFVGGVMATYCESSIDINTSIFINNSAKYGGVMGTFNKSSFTIVNSTFTKNKANFVGGVMATYCESSIDINTSIFINNSAKFGGVIGILNESSLTIINSTFTKNRANSFGGVMATHSESSIDINNSIFTDNSAKFGGVMRTFDESSFTIINSTFTKNRAKSSGGVMATHSESSIDINNNIFTDNSAKYGGVMRTFDESSLTILNSTFTKNRANSSGGVMTTHSESSIDISNSFFTSNSAKFGGIMRTFDESSFIIINSTFTKNRAKSFGGVMATYIESSIDITNSFFTDNSAKYGGVMRTFDESSLTIINSTFTKNRANSSGGVMATHSESSIDISNSIFTYNSAKYGGVMRTFDESLFTITNITFTKNTAVHIGGVVWCEGSFSVHNCRFNFNAVGNSLGMMYMTKCYTYISNSIFSNNFGSIRVFNSHLYFSGYILFENNGKSENQGTHSEGGTITIFQSVVTFTGYSSLLNNQASRGGAILATDSTIKLYGESIIANNMATNGNGGGIFLSQSVIEVMGNCTIYNNRALRGGGIYASSSTIAVHQPGFLQFINNSAINGSGIYLEVNTNLHVLLTRPLHIPSYSLKFILNHAIYGGAVYVADDTNSGTCSPNYDCFIQTMALQHQFSVNYTEHILFSGNTATEKGHNIFGGLLDRCMLSPFAVVHMMFPRVHFSGVSYLQNISSITALDSIASPPVRVCFCSMVGLPDCSYQASSVRVKKGETFTVSLAAVDQVNHTVDANIISSLSSSDGGFGEGQQTQTVQGNCTDLTFNVFSPHVSETIYLYAEGPCVNAQLSTSHVTVQFIDCTCPVGFQPQSSETRCECSCNSKLSPYITRCNSTTNTLLRMNTNSWIAYINDTDPPGYVIYSNCPFDYCVSPTTSVSINLNLPDGADAQCAYSRTGVLCGSCQQNLSLSLGSSRCLPCYSHWPIVFIVILTVAIMAGILLVAIVFVLNMTVATGLINGLIFYANIVAASTVFFPSSDPSLPTVLVAWLNLDIGLDVCFFDGLDAYSKTWLQLAFPIYILFLVVLIVIVSEYSPRFAALLGKRNPAASIALLILLPYAKLLSVTISALSFAILHYPDDTREIVWLPDGNIKYFQGKHLPLAVVALLIDLVAVTYAFLILFWQCLHRVPKWKIFNWTRNTKFNTFIAAYHSPYDNKHRYWTGLLLLMRVVLYVTASLTLSANPEVLPLLTIILVGTLIFMKGNIGMKLDKESLRDIIDKIMYLNLLILAAFTLYNFKTGVVKQTAIIYTSTIITFIVLVGTIVYHVALLIKKAIKPVEQTNEYPLAPVQSYNAEPTHSVIELPKPD